MKQKIVLKSNFDSAHRLLWHKGKCYNLHGHTYEIIATFEGKLNEYGIIMDFSMLKLYLKGVTNEFDHKYLNDIIENPTAENIIQIFWDKLEKELKFHNIKLVKLKMSEGINNWTTLEK